MVGAEDSTVAASRLFCCNGRCPANPDRLLPAGRSVAGWRMAAATGSVFEFADTTANTPEGAEKWQVD